jgi:hypothetical protein
MPLILILEIWKLTLEVILEAQRSMPEAQKAKAWERHEKALQVIEGLFARFAPEAQEPT